MTLMKPMNESSRKMENICTHRDLFTSQTLNTILLLNNAGLLRVPHIAMYSNVKCLYLNNNGINAIENLGQLVKLESIFLQENSITSMVGLERNVCLRTIDLSSNRIQAIQGIGQLEKLEKLNLSHNRIAALDHCALIELKCCQRMSVLDISNNLIQSISISENGESCDTAEFLKTALSSVTLLECTNAGPAMDSGRIHDVLIKLKYMNGLPLRREAISKPPNTIEPDRARMLTERRARALERIGEDSFNLGI